MDLQISKAILHTQSISRLSQFVTQLFELSINVDQSGQSYCDFGAIKLYFKEIKVDQIKVDHGHAGEDINFVFNVSSRKELEEFKLKLEFFYYREQIKFKPIILDYKDHSELNFIDPDGRKWLLDFQPTNSQNLSYNSQLNMSDNAKINASVRNY